MSVRYGVSVIPQPTFTAQVHRLRQTLCSQYASWAAEMHMVHLPLVEYFRCPEEAVKTVDTGLESAAREFSCANQETTLSPWAVVAAAGNSGNIFLEFGVAGAAAQPGSPTFGQLRDAIIRILEQVHTQIEHENHPCRIALMQHANLPPGVFDSAVTFAQRAAAGLDMAKLVSLEQLVFIRFESDIAGEDGNDWNRGGWSADLRWRIINSYPLN